MKLRRSFLAIAIALSAPVWAGDNDEFCFWGELGVEKSITKRWDVGLDLEFREQDKSRASLGLGTSYKVAKGLKFGLNYNFLYTKRPEKTTDKSDLSDYVDAGYLRSLSDIPADMVRTYEWKEGYNLTPRYWFPRHRFSADVTGSIKLWRWLRISLRERYQITHTKALDIDRYRYRKKYEVEVEEHTDFDEDWNEIKYYDVVETESVTRDEWDTKHVAPITDQVLRSRIKLEYDRKRKPFSPFLSAEAHQSVGVGDRFLLQKVRLAAGCSYKFLKQHELTLSYVGTFYIYDIEDNEVVRDDKRRHAVSLGYNFKF